VAVKPVARKDAELVPFGGGPFTPRDLALAYAIAGSPRALQGLQAAARQSPDDTEVLLYLAERYRNDGKPDLAIPLFERAGSELTALVGLGAIRMERGEYAEAIRLWESALAKNAGLVLVRTNLAIAYWKTGNLEAAEKHLVKAVALSPGLAAPAELLEKVRGQRKR
jgi:tetratricopeptide (TPR) repeat protein